jgi:hypothetical protein
VQEVQDASRLREQAKQQIKQFEQWSKEDRPPEKSKR